MASSDGEETFAQELLQEYEVPFTNDRWHIAGNYAHFVLRALLMIGMHSSRRELGENPAWAGMFEGIARAALPHFPLQRTQKIVMKKKAKRRLRARQQLLVVATD
jgi:hypothetical protein